MWLKEEQVVIEDYLIKYLTASTLQQELVNHTRQLFTLNTIRIENLQRLYGRNRNRRNKKM